MKYLILGAGPAGLAFANRLLYSGEDNFLVLEREDPADEHHGLRLPAGFTSGTGING